MGRSRSTYGRKMDEYMIFVGRADSDIGGTVILKLILERWDRVVL
jgi:hypothetical protein